MDGCGGRGSAAREEEGSGWIFRTWREPADGAAASCRVEPDFHESSPPADGLLGPPGPEARRLLGRLAVSGPALPARREAAIHEAIHAGFGRRRQQVSPSSWWVAAAAVALLAVVAFLGERWTRPTEIEPSLALAVRQVEAIAAERGPDGAASDPRVTAILMALVAMPPSPDARPLVGGPRFERYDLVVDGLDHALAAWRAEIDVPGPIVGIEGGDPPFGEPARYDPAALATGRVILAGLPDPTPTKPWAPPAGGEVRVATVVVRLADGASEPAVADVELLVPHGARTGATLRLHRRDTE